LPKGAEPDAVHWLDIKITTGVWINRWSNKPENLRTFYLWIIKFWIYNIPVSVTIQNYNSLSFVTSVFFRNFFLIRQSGHHP
jgi:hypothetical protein